MPYLGNEAAEKFVSKPAVDQFSGDGSTTAFTLSFPVASDQDILVSVDGVIQDVAAYAVSSGTILTFTAAPSSNSGNNIFVNYLARVSATVAHPATSSLTATTGTFTSALTATTGTFSGAVSGTRGTFTDNVVMTSDDPTITMTDSSGTNDVATLQATSGALIINVRDGSADGEIIFKKNDGSATDETMRINSSGHVTKSLQPAFLAGPSSAMTNVAHASTITLGTEIFDVGNNVASNVFTAPVTGKYFFSYNVRMEQVDSDSSYVYIQIVTSNRSPIYIFAPNVFDQDADFWTVSQSGIFDMDASDTAFLRFNYVNGSQQVDIGDLTNGTYFSGALIC